MILVYKLLFNIAGQPLDLYPFTFSAKTFRVRHLRLAQLGKPTQKDKTMTQQLIISVDLVDKARRSEDMPEGWTEEDSKKHIARYEKFLKLIQKYPKQRFAPTKNIDKMWHLHMLSPVAYYKDCQQLFGMILDHDGGFGALEEERPALGKVFEATAEMWMLEYGEIYADNPTLQMVDCWHDCAGRCWHACSSVQGGV